MTLSPHLPLFSNYGMRLSRLLRIVKAGQLYSMLFQLMFGIQVFYCIRTFQSLFNRSKLGTNHLLIVGDLLHLLWFAIACT